MTLRERVAEARGWTELESTPNGGLYGTRPNGVWLSVPMFDTSLDACQPLIEEMVANGREVVIGYMSHNVRTVEFLGDFQSMMADDSMAKAVCRLYLAWMERNDTSRTAANPERTPN